MSDDSARDHHSPASNAGCAGPPALALPAPGRGLPAEARPCPLALQSLRVRGHCERRVCPRCAHGSREQTGEPPGASRPGLHLAEPAETLSSRKARLEEVPWSGGPRSPPPLELPRPTAQQPREDLQEAKAPADDCRQLPR